MTNANLFYFPKAVLKAPIDLPAFWVKNDDELYALIDEIDSVDIVGLDTEFIKRNTFFPILALIQVNTGKGVYLVDAPRLDLTDFWQALCEVPMMVWYACGEDLGIFYSLSGCPVLTNVFDVQIAVAYLTGDMQVGFARAVNEILGVPLAKTESKSNWLARPLTPQQESYAIDDVRYLLALYEAVKDALVAKNLFECVVEDCQIYAKELYDKEHMPSDECYLNYSTWGYTPEQIVVLKHLVAWQEKQARSINRPRSYLFRKDVLKQVIENLPKNLKELSLAGVNRSVIRLYGDEVLAVIDKARKSDERLPKRLIYGRRDKLFKEALNQVIREYSQKMQIPEPILLKNRWLAKLCCLATDSLTGEFDVSQLPDELKGYRLQWVMQSVLPALYASKTNVLEQDVQEHKV